MPRDSRVYLEDILEATRKIASYTATLSKAAFLEDEKTSEPNIRHWNGRKWPGFATF